VAAGCSSSTSGTSARDADAAGGGFAGARYLPFRGPHQTGMLVRGCRRWDIRLANPRTVEAEGDLILRSGLSVSRGFDDDGRLDQGLAFVSFQRRLAQFLNTQARLAGEPLEEYAVPEGGGFYFALPGVADDGESLGAQLLAGGS
jgi:hypothetical protein